MWQVGIAGNGEEVVDFALQVVSQAGAYFRAVLSGEHRRGDRHVLDGVILIGGLHLGIDQIRIPSQE